MSKAPAPERLEISIDELNSIVDKAAACLDAQDLKYLRHAVSTLSWVLAALQKSRVSVKRLKEVLFGPKSEKTSSVTKRKKGGGDGKPEASGEAGSGEAQPTDKKEPPPGHGRNAAADYTGAEQVHICPEDLKPGDACPECGKGKVYRMEVPKVLVNVTGQAPLGAVVYTSERLRCNLCLAIFTGELPSEARSNKYDEEAASTIALLKYGSGLPFNRLTELQASYGIPLPSSTQWDIVEAAADKLGPIYTELIDQAGQGRTLYNDDTTMRVLSLMGPIKGLDLETDRPDNRSGIFTTGIVSELDEHLINIFFTGWRHAGENLARVLAQRRDSLEAAIQMCDALSRNAPGEFQTLLANCMAHARREFVPLVTTFPDQVIHVLEEIRKVYETEARAKKEELTPAERLALHQEESGPVMASLKKWLKAQLEDKIVEPNSSLGGAINYMLNHWEALTLFLRKEGAPIDNNLCERLIKRVILHRKNSYFYRTENGARVGDLFMSLISTARLAGVNPFDYLTELQRHHEELAKAPAQWMPWNYLETLETLETFDAQAETVIA